VIRSFIDREAQKIWEGSSSRKLPSTIQQVARRKLRMLNAAAVLDDLRPAGKQAGSAQGRPQGAAQYPDQRPMAYLFPMAGRGCA
jgi:toxin HigB-1